ncbi:MAG: hypothetical protein GPJ51_04895 [Candidatus Heimdallarchaeota archaeon]|nr:hypothetical protein [Candidatus Heimdallarchaeota archaeon]
MGIVCNLLLGFVEARSDKETVKKVLNEAGLSGKDFRSEKIYTEEEWQVLLDATIKVLGVDRDIGERMFAEYAVGVMADKFGAFFRSSDTALDLLRKVPKIHLDLPGSMGAMTKEKIKLVVDEENKLVYHYCSPNRLCTFLKVLTEQVFNYYNEIGYGIEETQCMKDGAEYCEIVITSK